MIKPLRFISETETDTVRFGKELVKGLGPGDIICLHGELGAGKTTLVKGIAKGLRIRPEDVHSPTFVLMNIYEGTMPLYHFDLYRLENPEDVRTIEYDEFLYGQGISVIEWAEHLGPIMPQDYIKVELKYRKAGGRTIALSLKGKRNR